MACKQIKDGCCHLKDRNGFCKGYLMMCGDDSVLFMDDFTKFKELKHRASKLFTNPGDALIAFRELKEVKENGKTNL